MNRISKVSEAFGLTKKEQPLEEFISESCRVYDLNRPIDIIKRPKETGDNVIPSYCSHQIIIEIRGLSDVIYIPFCTDDKASKFISEIMTKKADLTKDTYLLLKSDSTHDFIEIFKTE